MKDKECKLTIFPPKYHYAYLRHDEHSLNDVRSNGGRLVYASSISAKNNTLIEMLTVNFEKLGSYNIVHNS